MSQPLIVQYTFLLHQYGPDSEEAKAFLARYAENACLQERAGMLNSLAILKKPRNGCQTCGGNRLMPMMSRVPADQRAKISKVLKISYSLSPGSAVELPMHLCLDCGTVQGDWPLE
jgi:hypothetical protein